MPSQRALSQVGVLELQAVLALVVVYPVVRWLVRLPGRTLRYRRLLAELERQVPQGTSFVIRWDRYKFKKKSYLLFDTAKRGWQYAGQQITDDGWELLFAKAPAGARLKRHSTGASRNVDPEVDYLPESDPLLGGLPTPDYLRSRPGARETAVDYRRRTGVDVLDPATLEATRVEHKRWDMPHSRGQIITILGIVGAFAASALTLIVALHGAFPGWLLMVWAVSIVLTIVGSVVSWYFQRRLTSATRVLLTGYREVARAARQPSAEQPADHGPAGP